MTGLEYWEFFNGDVQAACSLMDEAYIKLCCVEERVEEEKYLDSIGYQESQVMDEIPKINCAPEMKELMRTESGLPGREEPKTINILGAYDAVADQPYTAGKIIHIPYKGYIIVVTFIMGPQIRIIDSFGAADRCEPALYETNNMTGEGIRECMDLIDRSPAKLSYWRDHRMTGNVQ